MNKQITEDYCSYEVAKLLSEKGFDEICHSVYDDKVLCSVSSLNRHYECGYGDLVITCQNTDYDDWENKIAAPTLQMTLKWLREVYNIDIEVYVYSKDFDGNLSYAANIRKYGSMMMTDNSFIRNTYEEAVEAAILYVLKNLI